MSTIGNFCLNLWRRIDWKFNLLTFVEVVLLLAIYPLMRWQWPDAAYYVEDSWVENIQLAVLFIAAIIAFNTRNEHRLFVFVGFILIFMILRETNLFRGYFCMAYLEPDEMCRWENFKYGYLVKGARWVFVAYTVYYFVRHKIWQPIIKYIMKAPIFIWDIAIVGLMIIGGTLAEFPCIDNEIMEECCELTCYLALANCVWRYRQVKI